MKMFEHDNYINMGIFNKISSSTNLQGNDLM